MQTTPLSAIVKNDRTFQFVGQTALNHPRSKSFVGGRYYRRAVLLLPAQDEALAVR